MIKYLKNKKARNDIILIVSCLFISAMVWYLISAFSPSGNEVIVYLDGHVWNTYSLNSDTEVEIATDYGENTLLIKDGKAKIISSDCPNQICVNTHSISLSGESITCIPHKLVVIISGEGGPDLIA